MIRGLYTSAAGMITQQRRHDTATNNISNLYTPGYKQGNAVSRSFPEMMIALTNGSADGPQARQIGRINTGVLTEEALSIYVQGDLMETKQPFDLAIVSNLQSPGLTFDSSGKAITEDGERVYQPQAFFTVEDGQGNRTYTRNGSFNVNTAGELVTEGGYRVLGRDGQPLTLLNGTTGEQLSEALVGPSGRLLDPVNGQPLLNAAGEPLALLLSRVEDPNRLVSLGNGQYRLNEEDADLVREITADEQVEVYQGYLERSNVDSSQAMIDMMSALRAYEANQKMVQYYDKSLEKAVNEVGKV
ncbi:flagellar hook-basal body protein [Paenibacillus sp. J2TS4]|uniref:flagellar hook-basal body protein n=1 Tax=Paenibacillus sp. J2TS4 TaxID=2807194 RepID=UPI001B2EE795|nr:flagellar hook-basal body protein [Paenibacillus sp. J2TS4]GIP35572.1 flagellar basal-body rod protein FlgF [Paenibacillus sp. J2TS4]